MLILFIIFIVGLILLKFIPVIGISLLLWVILALKPVSRLTPKTSIWIVMGKTGVGKTTYLALQARKYQKKGVKVYSNVDILGTYKINPKEDLGRYAMEDCLVIIDEAGLEFNSRDFKQFTKDLYKFFTLHRHSRAHVILSVQFWDRLDIVIRELVHRIFIIQPCFLKGLMKVVEVGNKIDINEDGVIVQRFSYVSALIGGLKYFRRKPAYPLFDTHSIEKLPEKDFELWGNITDIKNNKIFSGQFIKYLNKKNKTKEA